MREFRLCSTPHTSAPLPRGCEDVHHGALHSVLRPAPGVVCVNPSVRDVLSVNSIPTVQSKLAWETRLWAGHLRQKDEAGVS